MKDSDHFPGMKRCLANKLRGWLEIITPIAMLLQIRIEYFQSSGSIRFFCREQQRRAQEGERRRLGAQIHR